MLLGIRWGSLRTKIIVWSFVPTAIILIAVAWVTFAAYQQVTQDLVLERNRELTQLSAGEFAARLTEYTGPLTEYTGLLAELAQTAHIFEDDVSAQRNALRRAKSRLDLFDGGVIIVNQRGTVVAAEPERPKMLGQDWSNRSYFLHVLRSPQPVFSNIVADGPDGTQVIVVAVPIQGNQDQFLGLMAGMFHLEVTSFNRFYDDIARLGIGKSESIYLVDENGRVIYHSEPARIGDDLSGQAVVQQVLDGQVGALRTHDLEGRDIVASFAPVPGTPWGLVSEESWAKLIGPSQGYRQFLLLLLALGVVLPVFVVAVGVRRITKPITDLISAAQEVAAGNFGPKITAHTGDELEELAEQFNLMAARLQKSYTRLEQRVADRTKELTTLNTIAASVSQSRSLDLQEMLQNALDKTLHAIEVKAGGVYLVDEANGTLTLTAQQGLGPELVKNIKKLRPGEGFPGLAAQCGELVVVGDISSNSRLAAMQKEEFRSLASLPLYSKDKLLGALFAVTRSFREFTDQDEQLLTSIGHQVETAIENARLLKAERRGRQEASLLAEMAKLISGTLDLDEVLRLTTEYAVEVFDVHSCCILLCNEKEGTLHPAAQIGFDESAATALAGVEFTPGEVMRRTVFENLEALAVEDVPSDPHLCPQDLLNIQSALVVPIEVGGRRLGAMQLGTQPPTQRCFSADEGELALAMANHAAMAIENARLFDAEQWRAEQFRVISEVGRHITSILDINELLVQIVQLVQQAFNYDHVGIALIEGDEAVYKHGAGHLWDNPQFKFQPAQLQVGQEGVTGRVVATGEPLLVPDVSRAPHYVWMQGSQTRSELAVPIKVKGKVLGVLDVQSDRRNAFDDSDLTVLQSLAHQAGVVIENAILFEAEQRQAEQFRLINEVGRHVTSILSTDELLDQMVELIQKAFNYYLVEIGLVEGDGVVFKARAEKNEGPQFESFRLKIGQEGIAGWVAATGQPLLVPDVSQEPRYVKVTDTQTRSELVVPIKVKDKVTGVINVESERLNGFNESDLMVLQSLANQAAVAFENARLYEQAQQLAVWEERQRLARDLHDAVTQTLFSASLIAEALPALWEHDQEEGKQLLQELRQLSRGALAEMRTLLMELRPKALAEARLDGLLRQLAEAITGRTGLPVTVKVESQHKLPPDVHVAFYRIAQEALNNIVKHAHASRVAVHLHSSSHAGTKSTELHVNDDGRGFDPDAVPSDRLGLGIIRERAQAVGATLSIHSQPGHGTQVIVVWQEEQWQKRSIS
jgi:GAF domain-containing protein/HAMP domain-containing protein